MWIQRICGASEGNRKVIRERHFPMFLMDNISRYPHLYPKMVRMETNNGSRLAITETYR